MAFFLFDSRVLAAFVAFKIAINVVFTEVNKKVVMENKENTTIEIGGVEGAAPQSFEDILENLDIIRQKFWGVKIIPEKGKLDFIYLLIFLLFFYWLSPSVTKTTSTKT